MCLFCKSLFVLLSFFFWPLCCLFFDVRILITPLVSSNSSYYNWVDVTAGGHFVPEDIICPVAIKCMNLPRSGRILARTSPSMKGSDKTAPWTRGRREQQVFLFPKTRLTTRLFEIQIITLKTLFLIYVCVLVLFSYMIFWILMNLNNSFSFLNLEPKTTIFWLQMFISPAI